jgi:hypothetical protein
MLGQEVHISYDDLNTFDPDFITWNLSIMDVFITKLELTRASLCYGDHFGTLKEPILVLKHYNPLTFDVSHFPQVKPLYLPQWRFASRGKTYQIHQLVFTS